MLVYPSVEDEINAINEGSNLVKNPPNFDNCTPCKVFSIFCKKSSRLAFFLIIPISLWLKMLETINILNLSSIPHQPFYRKHTHTPRKRKMAFVSAAPIAIAVWMLMFVSSQSTDSVCPPGYPTHGTAVTPRDKDLIQFSLNLEYLEVELFLWSAFGYGLDHFAPALVNGGPPPIAPQKANLDALTRNIIGEFGFQEIGHIRLNLYIYMDLIK